jgi:site-specific DNA-cytosine methylase
MIAKKKMTSVEICAGAGGQSLGMERAGFGL